MRSITTLDLQYAHRFYGFKGEAQYLHGHTGVLTIEVEDTIEPGVNMVFPCNEIQKTAWEVLKNFDHALILREDDPLLPAILSVYEAQGIKDGAPTNKMKGPAFQTELATAYPDCRLVVTSDWETVETLNEEDIPRTEDVMPNTLTLSAIAFCETIQSEGYDAMIYTNKKQATIKYDMRQLANYPVWFAYYDTKLNYCYDFDIWQYGTGTVDGIEGEVDFNIAMIK